MMFELLQTIALLCANGQASERWITKCQVRYIECVRKKEDHYYKKVERANSSDVSHLFLEQCVIEKGYNR